MNLKNLTAKEYIKQSWLNYPTNFFSKFSILHHIFGAIGSDYGISQNGNIENYYYAPDWKIRKKFKNNFQEYENPMFRELVLSRQKILLKNKDWLEAALEMGKYWADILHSWNYYHPTEKMTANIFLQ